MTEYFDKDAVERALASWFGPSWLGRPSEDDTRGMTAALNAALSPELKALIEAAVASVEPGLRGDQFVARLLGLHVAADRLARSLQGKTDAP